MTGLYRVGNHQPQNVYRDDQYIGVMFTAEDAALVVEALNGREPTDWVAFAQQQIAQMQTEVADSCTCRVPASKCDGHCSGNWIDPDCPWHGRPVQADPACPVHQGRRARGPKPPPLGPGCICDGSGRTCPRHGAVI